jgi:4'-phosphopantetheinyl transferase
MRYGEPVEVADGVHVAMAPMTESPAPAAAAASVPSWRVREYTAVRALLREVLTRVAGPAAGATPIAARDSGQPFLPRRPDLTVSLSHSGEWVAAAVGVGARVGVDVQVPQDTPDTLVRRCCGPAARAALAELPAPSRDLEFAWLWTAQEACVKATGAGLAGAPWTIPVEVGQHAGTWQGVRWLALRDHASVPVSCAWMSAQRSAP